MRIKVRNKIKDSNIVLNGRDSDVYINGDLYILCRLPVKNIDIFAGDMSGVDFFLSRRRKKVIFSAKKDGNRHDVGILPDLISRLLLEYWDEMKGIIEVDSLGFNKRPIRDGIDRDRLMCVDDDDFSDMSDCAFSKFLMSLRSVLLSDAYFLSVKFRIVRKSPIDLHRGLTSDVSQF